MCMCVCVCAGVCVYVCVYMCVCVCVHVCVCVCGSNFLQICALPAMGSPAIHSQPHFTVPFCHHPHPHTLTLFTPVMLSAVQVNLPLSASWTVLICVEPLGSWVASNFHLSSSLKSVEFIHGLMNNVCDVTEPTSGSSSLEV